MKRIGLSQRQLEFIDHYTNKLSDTYDNVMQSAITAGYSREYAKNRAHIYLVPLAREYMERRKENIDEREQKRLEMLKDAENVLHEDLKISSDSAPTMRAIRNKTASFVAERVGRDNWSARTEVVNVGRELFEGEKGEVLELTLRKYLTTPQQPHTIDGNSDIIDVQAPTE